MATVGQWVQGARPRTLPAAIAPVLVGTAAAFHCLAPLASSQAWSTFALRFLLALVVALALQVGVNYANDYSDGVRGTDEVRVGPVRLVGQRLAPAHQVRTAALGSFAIAAIAGLCLVLLTHQWWLLLVGAAAIAAAWLYTGGPRPYGYAGLGELFVFVFFGLVAVVGSTYVQTLRITWVAVAGGVACGALSVAILLANNLRDIPTDTAHGKRTLAVRLGDTGTRTAYVAAVAAAFLVALLLAPATGGWSLLTVAAAPLALRPIRTVRAGATGRDLIPVLAGTGLLLLGYATLLAVGLALSSPR